MMEPASFKITLLGYHSLTVDTQTGDYSFSPTGSSYADWTKMTGYANGTLQWGIEPQHSIVKMSGPHPFAAA